jgi:hypothetical protein
MSFKNALLKRAVIAVQLVLVAQLFMQLTPWQQAGAETEEEEPPRGLIPACSSRLPMYLITKSHPRLLLTEVRLRRIHKNIQTNALASSEYNALQKRGEEIIREAPVQFTTGDLLEVSRTALKRIYVLAMLYQLTHESKWGKRAREEMLAAAAFPSWHPDHFLDTAEMTHAMSIGYDWCFDAMDSNERKTIANAIFELGLRPGLEALPSKKYFWVDEPHSNWNIVCCGGLLMGVLALWKESEQPRDDQLETLANDCIRRMHKFTSGWEDGDWCEGPSYWNYGTIYAATSMDALETSLGTDFNISDRYGFGCAGNFFIDLIGPTQQIFNFADASIEVRNSPQLFWFARRYKLPYLAYEERYLMENANNKLDPRDLIWFSNEGTEKDLNSRPLKNEYHGITQLVSMRSERGADPKHDDALFVAVKGGDNATHHSHLELGTFVFDASGCRWVSQLGMENYDLPGFFDTSKGAASPRWKYYRTRTEGQNTVVIDNENQDVRARGMINKQENNQQGAIKQESKGDAKSGSSGCTKNTSMDTSMDAELNLNEAYASRGITQFTRKVSLLKNPPALQVDDQLSGSRPFNAVWQIHTKAKVDITNGKAILQIGDKKLFIHILSPSNAIFEVSDVKLAAPQVSTDGIRKLSIKVPELQTHVHFRILLVPNKALDRFALRDILKTDSINIKEQ